MSVARHWATAGYAVALVSRSSERHASYLAALPGAGHRAYVADVTDPSSLAGVLGRIGPVDAVYFGPAGIGTIVPLPSASADDLRLPIEQMLMPLAALTSAVLPGMLSRGAGTILVPAGLSGLRPLPMLGSLAPASAAARMYALTLHAALAPHGVFVGTLTIGGLIARGDIHRMIAADRDLPTLDPDEIASAAWRLAAERTSAEVVFDLLPPTEAGPVRKSGA
jgi:NAD(P)-dependent dehydrogenase (short-subunit alcohol dehydrogenase family)